MKPRRDEAAIDVRRRPAEESARVRSRRVLEARELDDMALHLVERWKNRDDDYMEVR